VISTSYNLFAVEGTKLTLFNATVSLSEANVA
jgi:hypothetical protein